jgi:excisionase family DNA binding protein
MNRSDIDQLLTLHEAADVLHLSYETVRRRIHNKIWPSVPVGTRAKRMRASVVAAIASGEFHPNGNGDCEAGE